MSLLPEGSGMLSKYKDLVYTTNKGKDEEAALRVIFMGVNWEMILILDRVLPDFGERFVGTSRSNLVKGLQEQGGALAYIGKANVSHVELKQVTDFNITDAQKKDLFTQNDGCRLWELFA